MRRAAKKRARAVIHQDEIGDIDGQFPIWVQRMLDANARIHPHLFRRFQRLGRGANFAAFGHEIGDFRILRL